MSSAGTTTTTEAPPSAPAAVALPPESLRCGACGGPLRDPVVLSCGHAPLCRDPCAGLLVSRALALDKLSSLCCGVAPPPPTFLMKGKRLFEEAPREKNEEGNEAGSNCGTGCVFIECPVCDARTSIPLDKGVSALQTDLKKKHEVEAFLEQQSVALNCEICEEKAEYRCTCGVLVCKDPKCITITKKIHSKGADHPLDLTPITEAKAAPIQRCSEHGKPYDFFCTEDRVPVCYLCMHSPAHQHSQTEVSHKTVLLSTATKEMQETVLTKAKSLEEKAIEMKASSLRIGETRFSLENACASLKKDLKHKLDELHKLIDLRGKCLLDEAEQIEKQTDALLAAQQDFFSKQCLVLEVTSDKATKVANSIDPVQLCNHYASTCSQLDSLLQSKALLDPCCSAEVYFSSDLDRCSSEVNTFGNISFGVDLGKARWSTVIHPSIPLVGLPMKVTVTVLHLPDLSGSPIPEFLLIPSLQRLTFTICSDSDNIPSGADSLQFKWRNIPKDASASAEAQIQWVPQTAGRYSINLGSSTIAAVNVQDIDFSKSVISSAPACCNVGSWTAIKIEPKFVTGEKVPEEYFQLLSDLILVRCALLTQEGTVSDNQWNLSQSVVSVSFCLSQPGPHFLYIEGKHKLGQKFIPICGSPVRLLATQVDISKCTIKDFPGYITLNSTSKLQLQLFDQQGQPVDKNQVAQGHIQWKATVGPTPGISPQGQMAASVDSVEHILTLSSQNVGGWCNVSIEGTVDNGATFAHITGSPFVISCAPTVVTVAWDGRNGGYCSITNTGHTVDWTDPGNHSIVSSAREIDVPTYFEVKIERRECCGGIGLAAIDVIKAATNLNVYPHKLPGSPVCYSRNQEGLCHGTEAFKKGITLWDAGSVVGVLVVPHATNGSIRFFLNKQPIGGIANIKTTGLVPVIHMHKGTASSVPDPSLPPDLLFSL